MCCYCQPQPIQKARKILETCHSRLVDLTANKEKKVITLEKLSASLIRLRGVKQELNRQKNEAMEQRAEQLRVTARVCQVVVVVQFMP